MSLATRVRPGYHVLSQREPRVPATAALHTLTTPSQFHPDPSHDSLACAARAEKLGRLRFNDSRRIDRREKVASRQGLRFFDRVCHVIALLLTEIIVS